jgi:hypothetical protein
MRLAITAAAIGLLAGPMAANAVPFSFDCITNNSATNCATGENQLHLEVTDEGGFAKFLFTNSGPLASSITDVYFDWLTAADALTERLPIHLGCSSLGAPARVIFQAATEPRRTFRRTSAPTPSLRHSRTASILVSS